MLRIAPAVLLAATLIASTRDASAFCQTTTCKSDTPAGCPTDADGCPMTGQPLRWRKLPIVFRFSAQPPAQLIREEARAAIRSAFYRWSDTVCGPDQRRTALRFQEGEEIFEDKPLVAGSRGSAPFGIYFRDRGWPYEGKEDSTLAQTNNVFGKESGFIEYADMEINSGNTGVEGFSTKEDLPGTDLQAVITHEAGHYIGLAHSKVPTSIMLSSYCNARDARCAHGKVAARRLSLDDIDAVCTLYPPDYISPEEEKATAGCTTVPSSSDATFPASAVTIAALAVAAARIVGTRRRRLTQDAREGEAKRAPQAATLTRVSTLEFLASFKVLHEKARRGTLSADERAAYQSARLQLSRFVVVSQQLGHAGETLRSTLRMAKMLKVEIKPDEGDPIRGSTIDLASGGFALLSPRSLSVGKGATFTLNLPAAGGPAHAITGRCTVASSRANSGTFRVSFKFDGLDPDSTERLAITLIDAVLERFA